MIISIITVCKNAGKTIERTVQSVLSQAYPNVEYIIIDGQSTDNTLSIIHKYADKISNIISEKDDGIYDAMNKGISLAKGDILYFLNADDQLYNNHVVSKVIDEFKKTNSLLVYGKCVYENIPKGMEGHYQNRKSIFRRKLDVAKHVAPQQCFFYHKKSFGIIGIFDPTYKIAADMDWFLKFLNGKLPSTPLDVPVCYCTLGGRSFSAHIKERIRVFKNNMNCLEFLEYAFFAISRQLFRFMAKRRMT